MADLYKILGAQPQQPTVSQPNGRKDELLAFLDEYQKAGVNAQSTFNSAVAQGFDPEMIQGEMYLRMEDAKKKQEEEFNSYLAELRADKQQRVNVRRRAQRQDTIDDDVMLDADNALVNANTALTQLRDAKKDIESGDLTPGETNRAERVLESLGYDPTGYREAQENKTSPFGLGIGASRGLSVLQEAVFDWYTSARNERTPELNQKTLDDINNAIQIEEQNLADAVARQNEINSSVGLEYNFDPNSEFDVSNLTQEAIERLGLEERFEAGQENYMLLDYLPVVGPVIGKGLAWAGDTVFDTARILNAVTADSKGVNAWLDRRNAAIQGFRDQTARDIGLSENNRSRGATDVLFDGNESATQKALKVVDFALDLMPEAAAQIYTLGGKSVQKAVATGAMKYLTKSNVYLTSLGLKSAGSFRKSLDERTDLTSTEKNLMSLMVGGSELALAKMFAGAERLAGRAFMKTPESVAQAARQRATAALKDIDYGRVGWGEVGKQTIFEGFEEGIQATVQENIENVYDFANGVKPQKELNFYAIADGFLGGLLMGGTMASVGKLSSNLGHSKVKESEKLQKEIIALIESRINSEPDPEKRKKLRTTLLQEQDRLNRLHSIGNAFYDRLSEEDKATIISINQKLSDLRDRAQAAKGKEKDALKKEFESLYAEKSEIESKVITPAELAELSKERPSTNQLMGLIEEVVTPRVVPDSEVQENNNRAQAEDDVVSYTNQEVADQVYSLLDRAQAARDAGNVGLYGSLRQRARRVANASGIDGMDWVNVLDKYEAGERVPFPEVSERTVDDLMQEDSVEVELSPDGDIQQGGKNIAIPSKIITKLNRLVKSFSNSFGRGRVTAKYHKTQASLYSISDEMRQAGASELKDPDSGVTFGVFVSDGNGGGTLHIGPMFDMAGQDVVSEESLHFVLEPLLRNDDTNRKALFDELLTMAGLEFVEGKLSPIEGATFNAAAREIVLSREPFYDPNDLADFEEEMIMGFLLDYAARPSAYKTPDNRSALRRIIDTFANLFSKTPDTQVISTEDDLLSLARKVSRGLKGEETNIVGRYNNEVESTRKSKGITQKPFDYLEGAEVFYTDVSDGRVKSIDVRDYFHFRNWYNSLTENQRFTNRVADMYYIDELGVKRIIKRPKPNLDRNGRVIFTGVKQPGGKLPTERTDKSNTIRTGLQDNTVVYRAGDLVEKAEPAAMMRMGRSTGHFGTGFYFFSSEDRAKEYAAGKREVSKLDISGYNLARATRALHDTLKSINNSQNAKDVFSRGDYKFSPYDFVLVGSVTGDVISEAQSRDLAKKAQAVYDQQKSLPVERFKERDTISTIIMKTLGYEGVNAVGTNLDNAEFGTVIYDIKPTQDTSKARSARRARGVVKNNVPADKATWALKERNSAQTRFDLFRKRIVDKFAPILDLQTTIEESRGFKLAEDQDFRMAEELMYGKAAEALEKLDAKVKELTDLMSELNLTQEEVSDYLYALHVPERNRVVQERNGTKNGSGQTNEQAERTLERLAPKREALERVEKIVRDIQQDTRKTFVDLGLHSQETVDQFNNQFEFYVPLSGLPNTDEDSSTGREPYPTSGFSVTDPTKRAEGRKTKAENILAQIINQNAQAHVNGRTNEAVNALYNLVENNPNPRLWGIVDEASPKDPNVVGVRVNGIQKFIRFEDASYAESLRGMGPTGKGFFTDTLAGALLRSSNNWLRMSFTTLNPEFFISNFSRDIQSAVFNAAAEADIPGGILNDQGIVKDMLRNVSPSLKALLKGSVGRDMPPVIGRYFEEFKEDGGKTGWAYTKPLEKRVEEIDKAIAKSGGKTTNAQKIIGTAKNVKDFVEGVNDAFENAIRLSAYIAARENGVSRAKAAQLAKNVTVNFNKHGEYGQALNSLYLFFNASVQGTARLGKSLLTLKDPPRPQSEVKGVAENIKNFYGRVNNAQKLAAGLMLFNSMLTIINRSLSDEDEDGVLFYDKIPDYVKERNMIIVMPSGVGAGRDYVAIPMPYGFNIFANVGSSAVDVAEGARDVDEALSFITMSFISSFVPLGFGQSSDLFKHVVKAGTPTILKPLVEASINETYFGGKVATEQLPYGTPKPESSMSFRSPEIVKDIFSWFNTLEAFGKPGGSEEVAGAIDFNPDKLWYMVNYFFGGSGQFLLRGKHTFDLVMARGEEEDIQLSYNDIPFMRKFYGEPAKFYDYQLFEENSESVKQLVRERKNPDARKSDPERYRGITVLNNKLKTYNTQLKALRKARRSARKIDDFAERTVEIQRLEDKERDIIMKWNALYEELRGQEN